MKPLLVKADFVYSSFFLKLITVKLLISSCGLLITFGVLLYHVAAVISGVWGHSHALSYVTLISLLSLWMCGPLVS